MNMMNHEIAREELQNVESQIDAVVDQMIEKYGKFIDYSDIKGKDDNEKRRLVSRYYSLLNQKSRMFGNFGF